MVDLEVINAALRLGAELREIPVGSVVRLYWMSTRYTLTTAKVLPPIPHGSTLVECIVPGENVSGDPRWGPKLATVVGASRVTLPKAVREVVSLPAEFEGDPLALLEKVVEQCPHHP